MRILAPVLFVAFSAIGQPVLSQDVRQQGDGRAGNATRPGRIAPTHADVSYGPHARNVMDVWFADVRHADAGAGVDSRRRFSAGGREEQSDSVAVAAVPRHRRSPSSRSRIGLSDECDRPSPVPGFGHAAIQFIRHHAKQWKLDPTRIASTGGSAGAGMSLWLGFHDDLADPIVMIQSCVSQRDLPASSFSTVRRRTTLESFVICLPAPIPTSIQHSRSCTTSISIARRLADGEVRPL